MCDDGPFGKGAGGQLRYRVTLGSRTAQTVWIAVAGSDRGVADARKELAAALEDPDAQLAAKTAERDELAARSRVDLPGDRKLQEALDWGKQNLADLTQTATNMQIRFVDQGKAYPGAGPQRQAARRSSAPATPTTRGSSPPTASTRRSPRSRSASSRRSRTT